MNKIRLRYGDNEIEVEGSDGFIQEHLATFYDRVDFSTGRMSAPSIKKDVESKKTFKPGKVPSPAEFYKSKGRTDGISKLLIFAKYLELYKDITTFSRSEINQLAKEAKLSKDVHSQYFTNAVKQGLIRPHTGNKYSLTLSAEEVLASM